MIDKIKKIRLKTLLTFIAWFIITWGFIECLERVFGWESMEVTGVGLLAFVLIYSVKFHIWCCVAPFLVGLYKCRKHEKCHHEYCKHEIDKKKYLEICFAELDMIFRYKKPTTINVINDDSFYVKTRCPHSRNREHFMEYLLSQSNIFKTMELTSYWTDNRDVIFTVKILWDKL